MFFGLFYVFICLVICLEEFNKIKKYLFKVVIGRLYRPLGRFYTSDCDLGVKTAQGSV